MLAKLLKYDFKKQIKIFLVFDGLALLFAIISRLLLNFNNIVFFDILSKIFAGAMWAMCVNAIINTVIRAWANFSHSLYGDESYLIHTLPVKTGTIYWSKFITALLILLINAVVTGVCVLITYRDTELANVVLPLIHSVADNFELADGLFVALIAALLFLELFTMLLSGFAGSIIGHRFNERKIAYSILAGFGVYILSSVFVLICMLIAGIFVPSLLSVFVESSISNEVVKELLVVGLIAYVLIIPVLSLLSAKLLNHGVDVE